MIAQRAARALLVAMVLAVLSGCSQGSPPGEQVPALAEALKRVDAAVQSGDREKARVAVEDLVAKTARAEVAGDISRDESDAIIEAAGSFLEALETGSGTE